MREHRVAAFIRAYESAVPTLKFDYALDFGTFYTLCFVGADGTPVMVPSIKISTEGKLLGIAQPLESTGPQGQAAKMIPAKKFIKLLNKKTTKREGG